MKKLEIKSMVKVNGKWIRQEDLPPEKFARTLEAKTDEVMHSIGFKRRNTA